MTGSTSTLDLDNPLVTTNRRKTIESKKLLQSFYFEAYNFYRKVAESVPAGQMLELGSGAGFAKVLLPNLMTSDVLPLPFVDYQIRAENLPFPDNSLSLLCMVDTLHHIPDVALFFDEASRTLKPSGAIAIQEPANTLFSNFIYRNFHHEPFDTTTQSWKFEAEGPLSSANGALPWIVFTRDRALFERKFPNLKIESVQCCHPLLYLMSGGFSLRQLMPDFALPLLRLLERALTPLNPYIGMFTRIVVRKTAD